MSRVTIDALVIDDERSFRRLALYADLKQILRRANYPFRILPRGRGARWQQALLLNLTLWRADAGGDVLASRHLPADVVTHVAWHHLAARRLANGHATPRRPTAEALFGAEAIASAFDLYLVGELLRQEPRSTFLLTTVTALGDVAQAAGLSGARFAALLGSIAADPARAFEDLRQLLLDASLALHASRTAEAGFAALSRFDQHRFAPLLHHYQLSNWVLFARAHARPGSTARARAVDRALRKAKVSLDWLAEAWIAPTLASRARAHEGDRRKA